MASQLSNEAKEVILRVLEFCKEEKYNRQPIIPLNKAQLRVATATGVSLHTVTKIIREGKIAALNGTKIGEEKQRKPRRDKIILSKFDEELIKDIIQDYFKEHQEWPPLTNLLPLLRKQIGYTNSIETLRKALKQMGYVKGDTKKCIDNRKAHPIDLVPIKYDKHENHDHDYSKS